jgi:antitoxin FitA
MCPTCNNVSDMSKMIQLRHVPDELHRKLKTRAAAKGVSMSDYILREIAEIESKPTMEEWLERLHKQEPIKVKGDVVADLRRLRGR